MANEEKNIISGEDLVLKKGEFLRIIAAKENEESDRIDIGIRCSGYDLDIIHVLTKVCEQYNLICIPKEILDDIPFATIHIEVGAGEENKEEDKEK